MVHFEHFALNLEDPHEIADWYVRTMDCQVISKMEVEPFTVFLADAGGRVFWEIYQNSQAPFSDVRGCDPLVYHLAFAVDEPQQCKAKIIAAGGSYVTTVRADSGSVLIMMRDPWGIALQLCKRIPPFVQD